MQRLGHGIGRQKLQVLQTEGFALFKKRSPFGEHIDDGGLVGAHIHCGRDALEADQAPAVAQIAGQGFSGVAVAVQIPGVGGESDVRPGVDDGRGMAVRRVDAQVVVWRAEDVIRPVEIGELRIAPDIVGTGVATLDVAVVARGARAGVVGDSDPRVCP